MVRNKADAYWQDVMAKLQRLKECTREGEERRQLMSDLRQVLQETEDGPGGAVGSSFGSAPAGGCGPGTVDCGGPCDCGGAEPREQSDTTTPRPDSMEL